MDKIWLLDGHNGLSWWPQNASVIAFADGIAISISSINSITAMQQAQTARYYQGTWKTLMLM